MPSESRVKFERALADLLLARGRVDARALDRALRVKTGSDERLLELLPKLGLVAERDAAEAAAEILKLPLVGPRDYPTLPLYEGKISARFLRDSRVLPLAESDEGVIVAMADPIDEYSMSAVGMITGRKVIPRVAVPSELETTINRLYNGRVTPGGQTVGDLATADDDAVDLDIKQLKDLASEAPVIRLVNQVITRAAEQRASDVHIEPFDDHVRVRYRVDGVLREMESIPSRFRHAVISRIKIMARLNIAERRLPQDGRAKLVIRGTPTDIRVATAPTVHGESVALRLLDRQNVALDFADLGITGHDLERFLQILERPHGIVLVTGPTGSGKTTTLYAALLRLNDVGRKILSVEDPVEYQLEGINQIQVKQSIGLTFANVLRSFLRHDPDIIMVGEIRDSETADIAVHAALTGHLVLSTVHTNNAASSLTRLLDMGVADFLLTSTINGIAAQRLVRTLCPHCRRPFRPVPELVEQLGLRRYSAGSDITLFEAAGCDECGGSGYFGRTCAFETLVMSDGIRRLVLRHAESNEIHRLAVEEGMQTLYDHGMTKVLAGITTVEEVLQVTRDV
jgi:general secretion pathway protein E